MAVAHRVIVWHKHPGNTLPKAVYLLWRWAVHSQVLLQVVRGERYMSDHHILCIQMLPTIRFGGCSTCSVVQIIRCYNPNLSLCTAAINRFTQFHVMW
jgi:hypothetical protein